MLNWPLKMLFSLGIDRYMINKHMFTAGDLVMKYEDRKMRKSPKICPFSWASGRH